MCLTFNKYWISHGNGFAQQFWLTFLRFLKTAEILIEFWNAIGYTENSRNFWSENWMWSISNKEATWCTWRILTHNDWYFDINCSQIISRWFDMSDRKWMKWKHFHTISYRFHLFKCVKFQMWAIFMHSKCSFISSEII